MALGKKKKAVVEPTPKLDPTSDPEPEAIEPEIEPEPVVAQRHIPDHDEEW